LVGKRTPRTSWLFRLEKFCECGGKAKESCKNTLETISDHFVDVNKMVKIGSGAERKKDDILLTRYACYLIAQNGDPKKEEIPMVRISPS
jgi:DNA-damage-inducible protein D